MSGNRKLIFEKSVPGRQGICVENYDVDPTVDPTIDPTMETELCNYSDSAPPHLMRTSLDSFPELSQLDVVRHYAELAKLNFSVDENFYPLGSCTMKYNPRINEEVARYPGFANLHPETPEEGCQGALELMFNLGEKLKDYTAMAGVTLLPGAGAHGELAGLMMISRALKAANSQRRTIIIPDSAHGTNPATAALVGFKIAQVKTGVRGIIDFWDLKNLLEKRFEDGSCLGDDVAGIMITNPNTLGLFEEKIADIAELIHSLGGYVYMDGANLNALLGAARPGDFGVDALHINLHKTFSQPHGGGGPGAGPVVVSSRLEEFLPYPRVCYMEEDPLTGESGFYYLDRGADNVWGMREFYGNFGVFVRAYSYMLALGSRGLAEVSRRAVLNANYLKALLVDHYDLAYATPCLHEAVFTDKLQQEHHVSTLDIAKRLLDYGFHPPTVYFPLVVKGALMIEPTETESKETLDRFAQAMVEIAETAKLNPEVLHSAPHATGQIAGHTVDQTVGQPTGQIPKMRRLDEVQAARSPKLRF